VQFPFKYDALKPCSNTISPQGVSLLHLEHLIYHKERGVPDPNEHNPVHQPRTEKVRALSSTDVTTSFIRPEVTSMDIQLLVLRIERSYFLMMPQHLLHCQFLTILLPTKEDVLILKRIA
jgi:hypothetical protein